MMFDQAKHIQAWTTMACHVYDAAFCKVRTIAICNMQLEVMEVQCIMWKKLNKVMEKNGVEKPNFKGFMAKLYTSQQECCLNRLWQW
jgi:hypothetical protein